ncbi:hypothetical protein DAPPPG734_18555 [Pantoea agglomerans]|uniref:Uncharacterized protein n=1 Tax=Enterobacter agglomerans TaxID=549 RepID=A0AAN2K658_ENTAG|nr:hypothetical protein DAPPPG734_18555 [Pantoea agglomerans]
MWGRWNEFTISKTYHRLNVEMLYVPFQILLRILRWVLCTMFTGYRDFLVSYMVIFFLSLAVSASLLQNRLSLISIALINAALLFLCRVVVRYTKDEDLGVLLHALVLLMLSGLYFLI